MRLLFVLALLLGAAPALAQQLAPGENLLLSPPAGWVVVFQDRQAARTLTQLAPQGQIQDGWVELLTVQMIAGKPTVQPSGQLDKAVVNAQQACESVGTGMSTERTVNNYDTAIRVVACTKMRQSGMGEVRFYQAINGQDATYIVDRAWRGRAFAANEPVPVPKQVFEEWSVFMAGVRLCDTRGNQHPCAQQGPGR
jgi:hypothetical protein